MQSKRFVGLILLSACGGLAPVSSVDQLPPETRAKAPETMWAALATQQPRSFIVALRPSYVARAAGFTPVDPPSDDNRAVWSSAKARVLETAPPSERAVETDWSHLPLVQVRASTLDAALAMLDRDDVAGAYEVERYQLADAESFPLIHQPAAAAAGQVGAGTSVAVLDTGTDYKRGDFGSCTAPGVPASCRVAYAADFAPQDNATDDNGHGTNVAGIVAGVAPGAKILALDVFQGSGASSTDIISAINWAVQNRATYNIAALNLSLGGGSATSPCSSDAIGVALGTARSAGIAPVVASGNNGYTNALSAPACAPAAISVGAVYDANVGGLGYGICSDPTTAADQITCFSNSASFLTLLAPGAMISAAGYTMAGTSQATPHVAGAMAVLHAAFPGDSVEQNLARLTRGGKQISDKRNGVATPRIDLAGALGATPSPDTSPPTGRVTINGGAAATRNTQVTLAISAEAPGGVAQMCVTNTTTCTSFEAYAQTKSWALTAGSGTKTVTVFLRDGAGNTTTAQTSPRATIVIDTVAPVNGSVATKPGDRELAVAWTGFSDAGSGIAAYRVVVAPGATAPTTCTGTAVYAGAATSFTLSGLTNGTTYSVRVCAVDRAENLSTGATASGAPLPERTPPVGTLQINGGARYATSRDVVLSLPATDDSGVAQMCISDGTTCTAFVAYRASASYRFAADGARTLRVWYRDPWGNTSSPATASITVDTAAPTGTTLAASTTSGAINLRWTPASDSGSGVAGYKLVGVTGSAPPATCATGTTLYVGAATSYVHAVAAKSSWSYRVCASDNAGNSSTGSTQTVTLK